MKVSIIVLNYNGKTDTIECLESIYKLNTTKPSFDIIVVDNASSDDSVSTIKNKFPRLVLLQNSSNLGYAGGNNVGIGYALKNQADFIWLLNNDTVVDKNCLTIMLDFFQEKSSAGIASPKIYFYKGCETHQDRYKPAEFGKVIWYAGGKMDWQNILASHQGVDETDAGQYDQVSKTDFATGCSMLIKRQVIQKVGMLDTKFYLYYEDVDLCQRAKKNGFEVYYLPPAIIWHKNAETAGGTGSDLQSYYITRNRLLIGMRYAPWRTKLALFREAINMVMNGTTAQKQAVGDFIRKKYGPRALPTQKVFFKPFSPMINLFKKFKTRKK